MAVKKTAVKAEKKVKEPVQKPELRTFLGEIEKKAYEIYTERQRTGKPGDNMSDWLNAEKEIKGKYKI
jgi:hypothetical protein